MLRLSTRVCGSFLLNQRVIADWWQPRYRERMHDAAKERLSTALQLSAQSADSQSTPPADVESDNALDDAGMDSADGAPAVATPSSSSAPAMSLHEANALVSTFVSNHNTEDLSATLQYIREQLGQDLTPFHFHALLRSFNHHRDAHNALQLLEVMVQSGSMTLETYARMVDGVHVLAPADVEERVLRLVALAQDAFGGQVMTEDVSSEGGTTARYSGNEEGRRARELVAAGEASVSAEGMERFQTRSAPVLSSLLHHYSTTHNANTVASCVVVALWIRAIGVELGDWDTFMTLMSVAVHPESFPRVRMLFGHFQGFERGHVSVQAVLDRLVLLNEVKPEELTGEDEAEDGDDASGKATSAGRGRSNASRNRHPPSSSSSSSSAFSSTTSSSFTALVKAMRRSLYAAGGDQLLTAPIAIPFINAQTNDLEELLVRTLHPLMETGVGAHRYNAGHLVHALSLVESTISDDVGAMQLLIRSIREQERQARQQDSVAAVAGNATELRGDAGVSAPAPEPFTVPVHHLIDMGTVLNRMSASTLREVQRPFRGAIRRLVAELSDAPSELDDPTGAAVGPSSMRSVVSSCSPAVPTTRDLVKMSNYETQFIRTLAEAREALRNAIDSANAAGGHGHVPGSTQLMFYQLAEFCCRHPPRNPKMTPAGLEERAKWARYLDARDTSLALFGSARQSRDSMKHLFYHDNQLPALRSDAVVAKDFADVHRIFFGPAIPQPSSRVSSQAELQQALLRTRTTMPHTGSSDVTVPRYLWDAAVYNPFPAAQLANNSCESRRRDGTVVGAFSAAEIHQLDAALGEDADEMTDASEFFVELWQVLMNKTTSVGSNDVWYLQNTGMYLLLVRCLLHRLDWEAAVHLTRKMSQHAAYTYMMDHELTTIFREIGDPAGCLAFKVATKLFDGRITRDNQSKKEQQQQEQFS